MDIAQRDEHAIQYTKHSALLEGDTLVVLKYPNGQRAYDAYGFPLSEVHRVHSEKFLATGSKFFKEKLESEWLNHWAAKKARAFTRIPDGIKYFIDMTPPEEGDDAIELTSSLSCSPGVRYWFTAQSRLGVARNLVAGRDETTMPRDAVSLPTSPKKSTRNNDTVDQNSGQQGSELSAAVTSIIDGQTTGDQYRGVIPDQDRNGLRVPGDGAHEVQVKPDGTIEDDLAAATEKLKVEYLVEEVLDYCPIRHRACIERLLQVIEGKEPRLDSAPKVWTLAVLSKYFDCESTVVSPYSIIPVNKSTPLTIPRPIGLSDGCWPSQTVGLWRFSRRLHSSWDWLSALMSSPALVSQFSFRKKPFAWVLESFSKRSSSSTSRRIILHIPRVLRDLVGLWKMSMKMCSTSSSMPATV